MASIVETRMILFTVTSRKIVNSYYRAQTLRDPHKVFQG